MIKIYRVTIVAIIAALLSVFAGFGPWKTSAAASGLDDFFRPVVPYKLSFYNTHTREEATITYRYGGMYNKAEMLRANHLLRDHRNGHEHTMDSGLLDLLHDIKTTLEARHPDLDVKFHIISGYRSSQSNEMLRNAGGGQAKKSRHVQGDAIDIRVPGVDSTELRNVAWCLQRGGVGYYRGSDFVHVDTWNVRYWNWSPKNLSCKRGES